MLVVVDGNDGTGKSTLVNILRRLGYTTVDRGLPTALTDNPELPIHVSSLYIILDAPATLCQERLQAAGKDVTEKYHTLEDLSFYRARFKDIAAKLPDCIMVSSNKSLDQTVEECVAWLKSYDHHFIEPGAIIAIDNLRYKVTRIYKSGVGKVEMVGLEPLCEKPGFHNNESVPEMLMPIKLLEAAFAGDAYILRSEVK